MLSHGTRERRRPKISGLKREDEEKLADKAPQPHGGALLRSGVIGHDGSSAGRAISHGLHSVRYTKNDRIQGLIEKHLENPNPLDLTVDLARARALFEDWVDRAEAYSEALLAWHESYQERGRSAASENKLLSLECLLDEFDILLNERGQATEKQEDDLKSCRKLLSDLRTPDDEAGKPRKTMDIADGHKILLTVAKITDSINRQDARLFISRKTFVETMRRLGFATRSVLNRWEGKKFNAAKAADQVQEAWGQVPMV